MNEKQGNQIPPPPPMPPHAPVIPVQPNQVQMSKAPENPKTKSNLTILWVALGMFAAGVIGGILLFVTYPFAENKAKTTTPVPIPTPTPFMLPGDAVKIADCVERKGALYARDSDLPQGPIFMVYQKKVIGLEYELAGVEADEENVLKTFDTFNMQINHINTGSLVSTDLAKTAPGSYIDLYFVDDKTEGAIKCEADSKLTDEASASAEVSAPPDISPTSETIKTEIIQPDDDGSVKILVSPGE